MHLNFYIYLFCYQMPSSVTQNAAPVKIMQPKILNKEKMRYVYEETTAPADIVKYKKTPSSRLQAPLTPPPFMQLQPMVSFPATTPLLQSPCSSSTTFHQPPPPHQFFTSPPPPLPLYPSVVEMADPHNQYIIYYSSPPSQQQFPYKLFCRRAILIIVEISWNIFFL